MSEDEVMEATSPEAAPLYGADDTSNLDDIDMDEDEVDKVVNITEDGGVTKKILAKGQGWEKPETHDLVAVHYVGTLLDGTKFDSSRDRGQPFTFNLGEGRVIKGWDLGVARMKKGEKAVLTCKAEYAYGEQGSPPTIPPNATLQFEVELLSWTSVKDIQGDGGVIKTVVQEGEGWQHPGDRDEVTVVLKIRAAPEPRTAKPTALLSEEAAAARPLLHASPEEGVEFTVREPGAAGIPRGVAVAVKTMKRGGHVSLLLQPEYAYPADGSLAPPPGVPTGQPLEVEVKLMGWKKVEDVTDDGAVTMKVLSEDQDKYSRPNEGATVTLRYVARLPDGTVFDERGEGNELEFKTDEEQVPEGLDLAVMKLKEGSRALVTVPPQYAYGGSEHAGPKATVPPNTTVTFEVELVKFQKAKDTWEMDDAEKVAAANARKDRGNAAFKAGNLKRAIRQYDKAVTLINYDKSFPDDVKAQTRDVKRSCWLNLAACHLKQQEWKDVVKHCDKVLELDAFNIKALYRRAQAYIATQDFVEAEEDLRKGLGAEPANADLLALQKRLKVLQKDFNKRQAAVFGKMFKPSPAPKVSPAAPTAAGGDAVHAHESADGANNAAGEAPEAGAAEVEVAAPEAEMASA